AGNRAAAGSDDLVGHTGLAGLVDLHHRLDDRKICLGLAGGAHQSLAVLRKARAAKTRPGMQKLAANAAVEADAAGHVLDISADPFAKIGNLVNEGDLRREKGV